MPDPFDIQARLLPAGFHFTVGFMINNIPSPDFRFQEVSGLSVSIATQELNEGGENRFNHQLPLKPKYNNLVLKRGLVIGSHIVHWCKDAIEDYDFSRATVFISLLNGLHIPTMSWIVAGAYPVKWDVSAFNAEKSELAIETIELAYQHFKTIRV